MLLRQKEAGGSWPFFMPSPQSSRRLYAIQPATGGPRALEQATSAKQAEAAYRRKHPGAGAVTVRTHRQMVNDIHAAGDDVAERNLADTELPRE